MPAREAELARGFVLGEDDGIDPRTEEDFRRSGLSHLLAVSGQNVALLALLATPLLAALGIPLRMRLVWVLALIAVYVPLAGAGPSIVRAGVMGALSIVATLAGRRSSRLYALALAAGLMLAIDPGIGRDVGWQLSFAAVLGILLLAAPLRAALAARFGARGLGGALVEGAAMTIAATLATAPLIAFHFEAFSTTTLAANLLALPAVAPAMWLGMLAAAAGQVPGAPIEPINALNAPLLAYIAEVAAWTGRPDWAYLEVGLGGWGLLAAYAVLAAAVVAIPWLARSRRLRRIRGRRLSADGRISRPGIEPSAGRRGRTGRRRAALVIAAGALLLAWVAGGSGQGIQGSPRAGLRASVLDVGQGDAILLQPREAEAVLVDTGPPGGDVLDELERAGVSRLGAVIVTHDQSDHAGGLGEVISAIPVAEILHAGLDRETAALIDASGVPRRRIHAGLGVRSGRLRLQVLWPPAERSAGDADPNLASLVLLARWRGFSMLLCGDAEAEAVPIDPGPVDVLKVAHHGSADTGLGPLLDRARPGVAVISSGDGNPFGHPSPETLSTLAAHRVRTLRTDHDGTIAFEAAGDEATVRTTR